MKYHYNKKREVLNKINNGQIKEISFIFLLFLSIIIQHTLLSVKKTLYLCIVRINALVNAQTKGEFY